MLAGAGTIGENPIPESSSTEPEYYDALYDEFFNLYYDSEPQYYDYDNSTEQVQKTTLTTSIPTSTKKIHRETTTLPSSTFIRPSTTIAAKSTLRPTTLQSSTPPKKVSKEQQTTGKS